jgi:hypothetical protein
VVQQDFIQCDRLARGNGNALDGTICCGCHRRRKEAQQSRACESGITAAPTPCTMGSSCRGCRRCARGARYPYAGDPDHGADSPFVSNAVTILCRMIFPRVIPWLRENTAPA